jgi:redox-sensitive bicupin YhaK (pirin superfamily)
MTLIITPRVHDLGGFQVRRAVPSLQARSVGPFVFVDHMGPAMFEAGRGVDVRPHPHIGLATVTFLWAGRMTHRDTLGSVQDIEPGDVNWMTAGRGIAHSERTPLALREHEHPLHGLQTWVALPKAHEEIAPAFFHHAAAKVPGCVSWPAAVMAKSRRYRYSRTRCTSRLISILARKSRSTTSTSNARCMYSKAMRNSMVSIFLHSIWSCSIPVRARA